MKKDIHPKYYEKAKVTCACGNTFEVGATENELHVEVCSACHPFYTGTAKFIDTAGRVDKFQARVRKAQEIKAQKMVKKSAQGRSAAGGKVVKNDERIASKSTKRASRG